MKTNLKVGFAILRLSTMGSVSPTMAIASYSHCQAAYR